MNLYQISKNYKEAFEGLSALLDEGVIDDGAVFDTLEALEGEYKDKVENVAAYIKSLKAMIDANKQARDEMKRRCEVMQNTVARLEEYLLGSMESNGYKKLPYSRFNVSVRNNRESVIVYDEKKLSSGYFREKITKSVDKVAIKEDLQSGIEVDGAKLTKTKSLVIK